MSPRFHLLAFPLALALVLGCGAAAPHRPVATDRLADLDDTARSDAALAAASLRACPAVVHPRLWRVERDGRTSYLFGTYHVGVSTDRLPDVVIQTFLAATTFAFETIDDDGGGDELPPDPTAGTLVDALGPVAVARLAALLGDDLAPAIDGASAVEMIALLATLYLDPTAMLDDELERAAHRLDRPVVGLETAAELAPVVRRWLGVRLLRAAVMASRGRRAMRASAMRELADYCAGRDHERSFELDDYAPELTADDLVRMDDELVRGRNRAWLPRLEPLLAAGGAFVAVGAAHLRGKGSVVELLRDRGYRVTRVEAR